MEGEADSAGIERNIATWTRWLAASILGLSILGLSLALPGIALADDVNWATREGRRENHRRRAPAPGRPRGSGHPELPTGDRHRSHLWSRRTWTWAACGCVKGMWTRRSGPSPPASNTCSASTPGTSRGASSGSSEGRKDEAILADMEVAVSIAPNPTSRVCSSKLCETAIAAGKLPYALGVARQPLDPFAFRTGDAEAAKKAELTVALLSPS